MPEHDDAADRLQGFSGYQIPRYTPIPDELLDAHLDVLTGGELKVLLYIARHTLGYKRGEDKISAKQIAEGITRKDGTRVDYGTGLSIRQIRTVISRLEELQLIHVAREEGPAGSERNCYALAVQDSAGGGEAHFTPPVQSTSPPRGEAHFTPQEQTLSRRDSQESLSPAQRLTEAWFIAFGQEKPSRKQRESCLRIMNDRLAEGYAVDTVIVGITLCVQRGARGPQMLEYVIGEAHAIAGQNAQRGAQEARRRVEIEEADQQATAAYHDAQNALEHLTPAERAELEAVARARMPEGCSDRALTGMMAYLLSTRTPSRQGGPGI